MPICCVFRLCSVRRNSPAPLNSRTLSPICIAIAARRNCCAPPNVLADCCRNASPMRGFIICQAGARLNRRLIPTDSTTLNHNTAPPGAAEIGASPLFPVICFTSSDAAIGASTRPKPPPNVPSSSPSISICRRTRPRAAPSA